MPIEVILDSLDSVDEPEKAFFEKTEDGKFRLDFAKRDDAVKKPLSEKNAQLKREKDKLKAFEKYKDLTDDDWTKFQEWKEAKGDDDDDDDDDDQKGKSKKPDEVNVKKIVKEELKKAEQAHLAALKEKDDAIAAEKSRFDNYRFEQELNDEALEAGVIGGRLKKFRVAAINEGVFGYREGKLVVLDDDGEPTSEAVADKLKKLASSDDWKFFFEAKEVGGGSGRPKGKASSDGKELKRSKMTPKEKSDYIKEHGNDAFFKLPL
jgi:hypothetical protein